MTELLNMNDDCIYYMLKYCDPESLVAIAQTSKKLNLMATERLKKQTRYICSVASAEKEKRIKSTIASIGKTLNALNLNVAQGYEALPSDFFVNLARMCPNLQKLEIVSSISANRVFDGVQTLHQLEHLCVRTYIKYEKVTVAVAVQLAHGLEKLRTLKVYGTEWDHQAAIMFIHEAEKLECFGFDIRHSMSGYHHYKITNIFLEEFKSLCVDDPTELMFFLDFRELVNDGANDD